MKVMIDAHDILSQDFYARQPDTVARALLGMILLRCVEGEWRGGRIVETEAYFSEGDAANHAANGRTKRNAPMYGPPGHAYVYLCYGMHWMFNTVTEEEGTPSAVLIRAIEPHIGTAAMRRDRNGCVEGELSNGPGKVCAALRITNEQNCVPLFDNENLTIMRGDALDSALIRCTPRIGIRKGEEIRGRYYIEGNPWVSRGPVT